MLQRELVRRLGAEVCYLIDFNGNKDANDYLLEHGAEKLRDAIHNSRPVPLETVSTLNEVEHELRAFVKNGFTPGLQLGLNNFDNIYRS